MSSGATTRLQYVPWKVGQSPNLSASEIPPIQGTPVTSIPTNFARFLYPKEELDPADHPSIRNLIWTQLTSLIPSLSLDAPPEIRFKWRRRRLRQKHQPRQLFVDISMATSCTEDWNQSVVIALPDETQLRFIARGLTTHRSYFTMAIEGLPQAVSTTRVAMMVSKSLVEASLIDVWAEMSRDKGQRRENFTGKMLFVGQAMSKVMLSAREAKKDSSNIVVIPVGKYKGNKVPAFARLLPSAKPGSKIQRQPGWLIYQGRHYKFVYRNRRRWCTRCKADALSYHSYADCPEMFYSSSESSLSESSGSESDSDSEGDESDESRE